MEQVLYILGAGFSAPLRIPTMASFLNVARDMLKSDRARFAYFEDVIRNIDRIAKIKNWVSSDQHNLEEVLSILDMEDFLGARSRAAPLKNFVRDVVLHRSPMFSISQDSLKAGNWFEFMMGDGRPHNGYVAFACCLHQLVIETEKKVTIEIGSGYRRQAVFKQLQDADPRYSVISFNYDMLLEHSMKYLADNFGATPVFAREVVLGDSTWEHGPYLVKLHGSIDDKSIALPTWSKGKQSLKKPVWAAASHLIRTATQVRFVGFSFPMSDASVEYLVKASLVRASNLKTVDVICLDPSGIVKPRYDAVFASHPNYRFVNGDVRDFLGLVAEAFRQAAMGRQEVRMKFIEAAHSRTSGRL